MISIIVCTRNRSASLRRNLESIQRLSVPPNLSWETIVVDDGSTDDTRTVVESFIGNSGLNLRYVFQERTGVCAGRNAAIRAAKGQIIAFTDDDMVLAGDWLLELANVVSRNTSVAAFFGRTLVPHENMAKIAVREGNREQIYSFPCNPAEPGSSNNMIVRRSILSLTGAFDPRLGPGTHVRAGEDIDFTYRILRSGGSIRYSPEILAYHDHEHDVRNVLFAYGKGRGAFYCKYILQRDLWAAKLCIWEVRWFLRLAARKGDRTRALLHLKGLVAGCIAWMGIEIKALIRGNQKSNTPPLMPEAERPC